MERQTGPVIHSAIPIIRNWIGYIKGYVPGIRENGGQYTHSSTWLIQALTLLNDGDRAVQIFDLVNPIHHATNHDAVLRYQVEPYVIAADVYGVAPHTGRGGWTWYTGSAAWFYRAAIEFILGFQLDQNVVRFDPKIPSKWEGFELRFRRGSETWNFRIVQTDTTATRPTNAKPNPFDAGTAITLEAANSASEIVVQLLRNPTPICDNPQDSERPEMKKHFANGLNDDLDEYDRESSGDAVIRQ